MAVSSGRAAAGRSCSPQERAAARSAGQVRVGDGLGLDPLRAVHHEQRAFAGGQGAADFIVKVTWPGVSIMLSM